MIRLGRSVAVGVVLLVAAGCGESGTAPTGAAVTERQCPVRHVPGAGFEVGCRSPDGMWRLEAKARKPGSFQLFLAQRGQKKGVLMYRSSNACCQFITWAKPHLLLFDDFPSVTSLDPSTRKVRLLAGLSDLAVSPNGRWFAGEGPGDPQVDPVASTVYVLSVRVPKCLVVPDDGAIAGFTADSRNVIVRRPYRNGKSPLRQFALSSLKSGCPSSVATKR